MENSPKKPNNKTVNQEWQQVEMESLLGAGKLIELQQMVERTKWKNNQQKSKRLGCLWVVVMHQTLTEPALEWLERQAPITINIGSGRPIAPMVEVFVEIYQHNRKIINDLSKEPGFAFPQVALLASLHYPVQEQDLKATQTMWNRLWGRIKFKQQIKLIKDIKAVWLTTSLKYENYAGANWCLTACRPENRQKIMVEAWGVLSKMNYLTEKKIGKIFDNLKISTTEWKSWKELANHDLLYQLATAKDKQTLNTTLPGVVIGRTNKQGQHL